MKISAINGAGNSTSKAVIPGKISRIAYSAMFTLSLLSGISQATDTFTKNKKQPAGEAVNQEYIFQGKPVQKAQSVYMDIWGNRWVPYYEYKNLKERTAAKEEEVDKLEQEREKVWQLWWDINGECVNLETSIEELWEELGGHSDNLDYWDRKYEEAYKSAVNIQRELGIKGIITALGTFLLTHGIAAKISKRKKKQNNAIKNNKNGIQV